MSSPFMPEGRVCNDAALRNVGFRAKHLGQAVGPSQVQQSGQPRPPQVGVDQQRAFVGLGIADGQVGERRGFAVARLGAADDDPACIRMGERQGGSQGSEAFALCRVGRGIRHQGDEPRAFGWQQLLDNRQQRHAQPALHLVGRAEAVVEHVQHRDQPQGDAQPAEYRDRGHPAQQRRDGRRGDDRLLDHRHAHVLPILLQVQRSDLVQQHVIHVAQPLDVAFEHVDLDQLAAEPDGFAAGVLEPGVDLLLLS